MLARPSAQVSAQFRAALWLPGSLLFLDEPASGLDTVATRDVDELIIGLGRSGVTIFLGSAGGLEMSMIGPGARRWGCGADPPSRGLGRECSQYSRASRAVVIGAGFLARRAARGSGHLTDERADRFADVGVVPQEPVAAAFDAYEPSSGDAVCGLGREPIDRARTTCRPWR